MKIDENMKEWFRLCVLAAVVCVVLFGIQHCANESWEERKQFAKDNPVKAAQENCHTRVRGSRPACWTKGDWIEFCKHVECKQR